MPKKFYQLSASERLDLLNLDPKLRQILETTALDSEIATNLTENQISEIEIPLGLVKIKVDQENYFVPLATTEPSVIAAANHGAKLLGDFKTLSNTRLMSGQIVFYQVGDPSNLTKNILSKEKELFEVAKTSYPSIYERGGGLRSVEIHSARSFVSLDASFDPGDAMGANMINTQLEAMKSALHEWFPDEKILFAILSNEVLDCSVTLQGKIRLSALEEGLAEKIAIASEYAKLDPRRRATHNKGVMNGIEGVALATGNDTRALYASVYAAAKNRPLTEWKIKDAYLIGKISISLPLATAGGATRVLPKAKAALELLGNPSASSLASLSAAIGLANNFSALKALVGPGIQKGHMRLQARSLALAAGAKGEQISELTKQLQNEENPNLDKARELLKRIK